jgi:hypothetical protein
MTMKTLSVLLQAVPTYGRTAAREQINIKY